MPQLRGGCAVTRQIDGLLDAREFFELVKEAHLFPDCPSCASRPPPPCDPDAEATCLSHAMAGRHLHALEGVEPEHFTDAWGETLARRSMAGAVCPPMDELVAQLEADFPGTAETWRKKIASIEDRAPALELDHVLRGHALRVIRLASLRQQIAALESLLATMRVSDPTNEQIVDCLRNVAAVAKGTPTK